MAKLARTRSCTAARDGDKPREELLAGNESLFRRINETNERDRWPAEDPGAFRCECARAAVRTYPTSPRTTRIPASRTSSRRARYVVVEKRGQAGQIAEATDPRG